jgi:hypothetical protein
VNDPDELLTRLEALRDLLADRGIVDALAELRHDLVVDVRLEKRGADLAHGVLDIRLGQPSTSGDAPEYLAKPFGQRFKHRQVESRLRLGFASSWRTGAGAPFADPTRT